jgi:PAS domain S-box-containing protein
MIQILYVDDEEPLLDVCKQFLERSGDMFVDTAPSAEIALQKMSRGSYDAVVSDYQMPEGDGLEFLKLIRSRGDLIPFILFTGRGREEVVIDALNNGADFYLQKGGDPRSQFKELEHKVKEAVRRNRAENSLKLNESRLNKAQSLGMIGCWELDLHGQSNVIWGSDETFRIFGIPRPPDGLVELERFEEHIVEKEFAQKAMDDLISSGAANDIQFHVAPADGGTTSSVRSMAELEYDPDGRPARVVGVALDITERKKAETGLRRLNQELMAIKECNKAMVRADTEEELVTDVCNIVCDIAGYKMAWIGMAEQDEGKSVRPVAWSGKDGEQILRTEVTWGEEPSGCGSMGTAIKTGRTVVMKDLTNNPCMRPWWGFLDRMGYRSMVAIPIVDSGVTFGGFAIYVDDPDGFSQEGIDLLEEMAGDLAFGILGLRAKAKQAKTEEAFNNSKEQYAKLLAAIPDFVITTDMNGIITLVNDITLELGGYAMDEVVGHSLFSFISKEDVGKALSKAQMMVAGKLGPIEYHLIMKDGRQILFEANGDVVRDSAGIPTGMVFVGRDITDRRTLEAKLREANRKLRVMDSITRHDTLNKLIALQGYVELMRRDRQDPNDLDRLRRMDQIVKFLTEQVNVSKEYQKIGADDPKWQSVRDVCLQAAALARSGKATIDIEVEELEILADPLLYKVFYNLMENSLRHGMTVDRIVVSEERSGDGMKIILSDNGLGIADEDRANLFKEGFGKVHGLGLFLSREILDITGMTIVENGEQGKGARFEIWVPNDSFRTSKA